MNKKVITDIFLFFIIILFCISLLTFSSECAEAVRNTLILCACSVIPSLFPFYTAAKLITNLRLSDYLTSLSERFMPVFFSVGGSAANALILGLTGGYPIGAVTCATLIKEKKLSQEEASHVLAFCNNCGPAFIIGAVGVGMFTSVKVGLILFCIHLLAALATGVLLRIVYPLKRKGIQPFNKTQQTSSSFSSAFTDAVSSAVKSCITISGYIVLFTVISKLLTLTGILPLISSVICSCTNIPKEVTQAFISGFFEMTTGIYMLADTSNFPTSFIITSFLLGWGGLSVHAQTLSVIGEQKPDMRLYFFGKLIHGFISAFLALFSIRFFSPYEVYTIATPSPSAFPLHTFPIYIFLLAFIYIFCKKGWKKAE